MEKYEKGDVILVHWSGPAVGPRRPALVVSNGVLQGTDSADVIIIPIRSDVSDNSKIVICKDTPAGRAAGLKLDSFIDCSVLATVPVNHVHGILGKMQTEVMAQVDEALRTVLQL